MAYVITGGTGHIGNNLARYLVSKNENVRLLLRRKSEAVENLNVEYVIGDIFDEEFLTQNIHEGDKVIHLAGIIDIKNKLAEETNKINYLGTVTITNVCIKNKAKHFLYCSSVDAIYKENNYDKIVEPEVMEIDKFKWNYPRSKAKATAYVMEKMKEDVSTKISIVYPSAVFGVNDYKPSYVGKVICDVINNKMEFGVKGGYNFIDVDDVVYAMVKIVDSETSSSYILSGNNVTVFEMYDTINKVVGKNKKVWKIPLIIAEASIPFVPYLSKFTFETLLENHNYDNSKAIKELGISITPFEKTVKKTVKWFREYLESKKRNKN